MAQSKFKFKIFPILAGFAIFLVIINGVMATLVAVRLKPQVAQAKSESKSSTELSANCKSLLNGGVSFTHQKVITLDKNKELSVLSKEVTMLNGIKLSPDGGYKGVDGVVKNLAVGDFLDFQGNPIPAPECKASIELLDVSTFKAVEAIN
jgi:hypothetical protein